MDTNNKYLERVSSVPDICRGKPCIKGTRIPVYMIISLLAQGETLENIIKDYPSLTTEDITASLFYSERLCEFEAYAL